jgi:hypothetical protein
MSEKWLIQLPLLEGVYRSIPHCLATNWIGLKIFSGVQI